MSNLFQCPKEFNSNLSQHICLEVSINPEDLDYLVKVCLIEVGAKFCRIVAPLCSGWSLGHSFQILFLKAHLYDNIVIYMSYMGTQGIQQTVG